MEALKIAYPKYLSDLSGNHTSSAQQDLVRLHKVLMLVQGCYSENKHLSNSGFEEQTQGAHVTVVVTSGTQAAAAQAHRHQACLSRTCYPGSGHQLVQGGGAGMRLVATSPSPLSITRCIYIHYVQDVKHGRSNYCVELLLSSSISSGAQVLTTASFLVSFGVMVRCLLLYHLWPCSVDVMRPGHYHPFISTATLL